MKSILKIIILFRVILNGMHPIRAQTFRPPCPGDSAVLRTSFEKIRKTLKDFKIIPDLLNEPPKLPVKVEWIEDEAEFGNFINIDGLKLAPSWVEWKCENNEFHTVMMLGLDEPSFKNPLLRQYQFWVIGNVEGYDTMIGEHLTDWVPPQPANNTGSHRYVVLVYRQPKKIHFTEHHMTDIDYLDRRGNFSHQLFAAKYNLGKPIAINFFISEHGPPALA